MRTTSPCARSFALVCLLALFVAPAPVRAWTDARVLEVEAEVLLRDEGEADVALGLLLEVRDGWLAQLELSDLADELTLADDEPVVLTTARGERLLPKVEHEDGTLSLGFARERAPERGIHRVLVRFRTHALRRAALADGRGRVYFGLPGWESGLVRAGITLRASHALTPVADDAIAQRIQTSPDDETAVHYERVHVPRATPWEVAIDRSPPSSASALTPVSPQSCGSLLRPRFAAGALLVLLCGLLARLATLRRGRAAGLSLSDRGALAYGLALLLGVAAVLVSGRTLALSLGLLVLVPLVLAPRVRAPAAALVGGRFVPVEPMRRVRAERRAQQRWLRDLRVFDGTTALGATVLLGLLVLVLALPGALDVASDPYGLSLACVAPCFFVGARLRFPRDLDERLALLARAARRCNVAGCGLRLLGYVDADGVLRDPRLRVLPATTPPGLLRIEVLADTRRDVPPLVVAVTVEPGSPSARALASTWPAARIEQDAARRRTCLLLATDALDLVLERLLDRLAEVRSPVRPSRPPPRARAA